MRKITVFILVIAFHALVLGVVYLSTRTKTEEKKSVVKEALEKKKGSEQEQTKKNPFEVVKETKDPQKFIIYEVQKGDFLGKIASKHKVTSQQIIALNELENADMIQLGQKLKIPVAAN